MRSLNTANVRAQANPPSIDPTTLTALTTQAETDGTVLVIVQLDTRFAPVGQLSFVSAFAQEWRIANVQSAVVRQLNATEASVVATYNTIPYMVLEVSPAALADLATMDGVISIVEDKLSYPTLASSVPNIGGNLAWNAGYTGAGQAIVIIDSGVESSHNAFGNGSRVVAEACFSTTYAPLNTVSVCPGEANSSTATGSGVDCVDTATALGYSGAATDCTHGTHVAGIAAGNDGSSNIGVAPDADIIAIQAASIVTSTNHIAFYDHNILDALQYVLTLHNTGNYAIASVNMSLGDGTQNADYCDASQAAQGGN
ncbi:MAG: S8 family serine peptidase [Caldilineaceae bacterium]